MSAHWYVNATAVTAMPRPRTIHDFYGFPEALYRLRYPATGAPALAEQADPALTGADQARWLVRLETEHGERTDLFGGVHPGLALAGQVVY